MLAIRSASCLYHIIILNCVISLIRSSEEQHYTRLFLAIHTRTRTLSVIDHQHSRVAGVRARDPIHYNDGISCLYLCHARLHRCLRLLRLLRLRLKFRLRLGVRLRLRIKLRRRWNGLGKRRRRPLRNSDGPRPLINAGERGNAIPQVEQHQLKPQHIQQKQQQKQQYHHQQQPQHLQQQQQQQQQQQ